MFQKRIWKIFIFKSHVLCRTQNALWHWILWIGSWTLPKSKKTILEYIWTYQKVELKNIWKKNKYYHINLSLFIVRGGIVLICSEIIYAQVWIHSSVHRCGADVVLNPLKCNLTEEVNKVIFFFVLDFISKQRNCLIIVKKIY